MDSEKNDWKQRGNVDTKYWKRVRSVYGENQGNSFQDKLESMFEHGKGD